MVSKQEIAEWFANYYGIKDSNLNFCEYHIEEFTCLAHQCFKDLGESWVSVEDEYKPNENVDILLKVNINDINILCIGNYWSGTGLFLTQDPRVTANNEPIEWMPLPTALDGEKIKGKSLNVA
jgi:hypothetical protein